MWNAKRKLYSQPQQKQHDPCADQPFSYKLPTHRLIIKCFPQFDQRQLGRCFQIPLDQGDRLAEYVKLPSET